MADGILMMAPDEPCVFFCLKLDSPGMIGWLRSFSLKAQYPVDCPSMVLAMSCATLPPAVA